MAQTKENPNDILLVRNVDVDCDMLTSSVKSDTVTLVDDEGNKYTEYQQVTDEFNHSDYFQVKWGGQPFRVKPGASRRMPRFIAEHFAKHLTDHILGRREMEEKKPNLINNPNERKKVVDQIIVSVDEYFEDLGQVDEATEALQTFEALNAPSGVAEEFGMAGKSGVELREETVKVAPTKFEEVTETEEILKNVTEDSSNTGIPEQYLNVTKADIIKEIRVMDPLAKLTGKESKIQLVNKLRGF